MTGKEPSGVPEDVSIRQATVLSNDELQRLFRWSADAFGVAHLGLQWRPKETRFLLDVAGEPVSHVGLLKHVVRVGGHPVIVAGFGGVVTVPSARGRGHATALMKHATQFVTAEWQVRAGLLFCLPRLIPYYARLGWRMLDETVNVQQPSGTLLTPIPVMVLPIGGPTWPGGTVELDSQPW